MTRDFKKGLMLCAVIVASALAGAAGLYTNGMPTVGAGTYNTATIAPPSGVITQVPANCFNGVVCPLIPMDTNQQAGAAPQTVAVTPFQVAAVAAEVAASTATSTVAAATLNTVAGTITTEALSTAAGATYTFTLTNSLITATNTTFQAALYSKSNTGGRVALTSVTNAAGSTVLVFTNVGTTALNGTMILAFHI